MSRSAVLAVIVSMAVFIVGMRPVHRVTALAVTPVAVAAIFVTSHGMISTLKSLFSAGTSDPSIAHRVNAYPLVAKLVDQSAVVRPGRWYVHRLECSLYIG